MMMKNLMIYSFVLVMLLVGCSEDESAIVMEETADCGETHELVGQSMDLSSSTANGISGTVTIVSDCEIQISNFVYNGAGPNVSIYGGTNGDFESGISLSNPINGTVFQGETLTVFLPDGTSLDEINSFSVWCFEFNIDFGSVQF